MFVAFIIRLRIPALLFTSLFGIAFTSIVSASSVGDQLSKCYDLVGASEYSRAEETAKSILQTNSDREVRYYALFCLGKAYDQEGRKKDALNAYLQRKDIAETTEELADAYFSLGQIYFDLEDLNLAELNSQRAIKAYKKLGKKDGEYKALGTLALVSQNRGDFEKALALNYQILKLSPEDEHAVVLGNIAGIHNERKEYAKAVKVMRQALELTSRSGDPEMIAIMQVKLGAGLRDQGKLVESEKELMNGYNALKLIGNKDWEAKACAHLASLALTRSDFNMAKEWYAKEKEIRVELGEATGKE